MEEQKHVQNQGLLDALESLSAALSVVSLSVDMVREELQVVLSMLNYEPVVEAAAPVSVSAESSPAPVSESEPTMYLVESVPDDAPVTTLEAHPHHEIERQGCLTCAI